MQGTVIAQVVPYSGLYFSNSHLIPFLFPQQSTKVPQTPLHTSRVLKEDKERWEDVKVRVPLDRGRSEEAPAKDSLGLRSSSQSNIP